MKIHRFKCLTKILKRIKMSDLENKLKDLAHIINTMI